jgi:hypothetical protein
MPSPATLEDLWFIFEELCKDEKKMWELFKSLESEEEKVAVRARLQHLLDDKWEICRAINELQADEIIEVEGCPF